MLLVKTKIGPSKIQGLGLFAAERIPKGTCVWKFMPGLDLMKDKEEVDAPPFVMQEHFFKNAYLDERSQKYILSPDGSMFINHSEQPNLAQDFLSDTLGIDVAARDIEIGEELTEDYKDYDDHADFNRKMQIR